jgi:hypothetical protein
MSARPRTEVAGRGKGQYLRLAPGGPEEIMARSKRTMYARASRKGRCVEREFSPVGVKARGPVAWMAGRRETEFLKPIDKAVFGTVSE